MTNQMEKGHWALHWTDAHESKQITIEINQAASGTHRLVDTGQVFAGQGQHHQTDDSRVVPSESFDSEYPALVSSPSKRLSAREKVRTPVWLFQIATCALAIQMQSEYTRTNTYFGSKSDRNWMKQKGFLCFVSEPTLADLPTDWAAVVWITGHWTSPVVDCVVDTK